MIDFTFRALDGVSEIRRARERTEIANARDLAMALDRIAVVLEGREPRSEESEIPMNKHQAWPAFCADVPHEDRKRFSEGLRALVNCDMTNGISLHKAGQCLYAEEHGQQIPEYSIEAWRTVAADPEGLVYQAPFAPLTKD